jgi:hypothetical protein
MDFVLPRAGISPRLASGFLFNDFRTRHSMHDYARTKRGKNAPYWKYGCQNDAPDADKTPQDQHGTRIGCD